MKRRSLMEMLEEFEADFRRNVPRSVVRVKTSTEVKQQADGKLVRVVTTTRTLDVEPGDPS